MQNSNNLEEFLKELTELTKKYGLYIDGCSCCGSPNIFNMEDEKIGRDLYYDCKKEEYELRTEL